MPETLLRLPNGISISHGYESVSFVFESPLHFFEGDSKVFNMYGLSKYGTGTIPKTEMLISVQ